ncbi:ABC transporter permease [Haloplanus pelagicus]|jgi:NitT/TauT family transport system permease protein|uniref:ABC transporter permease n=1 Tax=Haloplanus pelagicus TaxID=2949995 RepID=UPI00203FBFD1|nr:ABC transporter permease subunit [Haloplanus sp. HW8-1]
MAVRDIPAFGGWFGTLSRRQKKSIVQITAVLAVLLLWEAVGQALGANLFAPFTEVVASYIDLFQRGAMVDRLIKSVTEMFMGFGLAVAFAVPVGLLMGRSRRFDSIMTPWVSAFFATSTSALLPLLIVVLGIDLPFRITIIWLACVWHILLNLYHGARGVNQELIDVGQSFDASSLKIFKDITLPAVIPFLVAGLRMGLTRAIRGFILAETYIRTGYGGFIMDVGNQSISTAPVLALIINIMLLGYVTRRLLDMAQEWLAPWASDMDTAL